MPEEGGDDYGWADFLARCDPITQNSASARVACVHTCAPGGFCATDVCWALTLECSIDSLLMGRKTFDAVASFDCPWPYPVPVTVLTSTLKQVPDKACCPTPPALLLPESLARVRGR